MQATGIGDMILKVDGRLMKLEEVWVVPGLSQPLFSVRKYNETKGCRVTFDEDIAKAKTEKGIEIKQSRDCRVTGQRKFQQEQTRPGVTKLESSCNTLPQAAIKRME